MYSSVINAPNFKFGLCRTIFFILIVGVLAQNVSAQNLDQWYPGKLNLLRFPESDSLAQRYALDGPRLTAPIALLVELETGTVLYGKQEMVRHSPASLTKIMTLYSALQLYEQQGIGMEDTAQYSSDAWWQNAPPHSSLMFLSAGQHVSIGDLILGLLVSSGNDAAMAVAETSAGSMEAFIDHMNENASSLGLGQTVFVEPSGYSSENLTSARDLARLTQQYLLRWPWVIDRFHRVQSFTYPQERNLTEHSDRTMVEITQYNRNGLLSWYPGITGLKTGYIDQSGYNIIASARRDGMHLAAIIMGIQADNSDIGSQMREADAAELLDWGFKEFYRARFQTGELRMPVRRGEFDVVESPGQELSLILKNDGGELSQTSRRAEEVLAPVSQGQIIERVEYRQGDVLLGYFDRAIKQGVEEASFPKYIWESVRMFFQRLFGSHAPLQGDVEDF